jgi:hypothetical protein
MPEVFAGFVCGYALSLALVPLAAVALVRARPHSALLERIVPPGTSLIAVSVILHLFALLVFTAIGMLLGLMLSGLEERRPAGGLGSPNAIFTVMVIAMTAIAVLPLAAVAPPFRRPLIVGGLVFVAVFGWLMPYLALLGDEP